MAFIPIPNGATLCFDFTTDGQMWQFCLTIQKRAGAPSTADLDTLTTIGEGFWTDHLKGFLSTPTTLRQIRATDQTSESGPASVLSVAEAATGSANSLPLGTAIVNSFRTGLRGRSYRGRAYLGGLQSASLNTPTTMKAADIVSLLSYWADLANDLDAAGFDHVVASKQHNGAVTNPAVVHVVTDYIIDTLFDSQRRRLAGRGQ